jgi:hypothetical protein
MGGMVGLQLRKVAPAQQEQQQDARGADAQHMQANS